MSAGVEFVERALLQFRRVAGGEVRKLVPFQVRPDLLDRVEFRSVRRQQFDLQTRVIGQQLANLGALVHAAAVPDQDDRATQVTQQLANEPSHRRRFEMIVGKRAEVEAQTPSLRRDGQSGDERDLVAMLGPMLKDGSFALGSQGAADQRTEQSAAFVEEDQMGP